MLIESKQNKQYKEALALKTSRGRKKANSYYIEGIKLVEEALRNPDDIIKVFYQTGFGVKSEERALLEKLEDNKIIRFELPKPLFKEISDTEQTQGILAVLNQRWSCLDDFMKLDREKSTLLLLDRVQDPGNIGTIIRTAEALKVDGIIFRIGSADPFNPKVVRSTMGSILRMPLFKSEDIFVDLENIKKSGYRVLATSLEASEYLHETEFDSKNILIIGNEANGVDDELFNLSDKLLKIKMLGAAESLNAAIATGIILHEIQTKVYLPN